MSKLVAIFLSLFLASPVLAYVPPSFFMIKTMASKHAGYKGIRIRSTVKAIENGQDTEIFFKETSVFDAQTNLIVSRAFDENGKLLYTVQRNLSSSPVLSQVIFSTNPNLIAETLKSNSIPVRTEEELLVMKDETERVTSESTGLKRYKNTLAWVLGLNSQKGSLEPQLWIEKDSFLPVRLILSSQEGMRDISLENYRYYKDYPFPKIISLAGYAGIKTELNDVLINPESGETRKKTVPGYTDEGNSASSAIRELIRRYYSLLR
ncbi:MAG: hypothetical protein A3K03_10715 [Bdellovibrionales bacterium RIFOXYD1_FULL_44_7]|nr:MAG: hypothetical protein A3K03_10715 [Bdellovibrionales bacterium RIFOXYD1_FULL_44_7]